MKGCRGANMLSRTNYIEIQNILMYPNGSLHHWASSIAPRMVAIAPLRRHGDDGFASVTSSVVNVFDNLVALAIVSIPWCFKESGLCLGLAALGISAAVAMLSFEVLTEACAATGMRSYKGLAEALGGYYSCVIEAARVVYLLFVNMCMTIVVCDDILGDGTGVVPAVLGLQIRETAGVRLLVCGVYHGCITLPLALSRTLEGYKQVATLALAAAVYVVAVLLAAALNRGGSLREALAEPGRPAGLVTVLPALNYLYMVHYNVPRYYDELKRRSLSRIRLVFFLSTVLSTILFAVVGVAGYLCFGSDTKSNVLLNLGATSPTAIAARVAILFIVATSLGKNIHSIRDAATRLLFPHDNAIQARGADELPDSLYIPMTVAFVGIIAVGGGLLRGIGYGEAINYNAAVVGTFISFVFPALVRFAAVRRADEVVDSSYGALGDVHDLLVEKPKQVTIPRISPIHFAVIIVVVTWGVGVAVLFFVSKALTDW